MKNIKNINKGVLITFGFMLSNLLTKVLGLLRELLLAQYYGTSSYTDAYIIANNIPTVLFAAFGAALGTTFVPMYSKIQEDDGEKRANSFAVHMIKAIIVICLGITLFGEIFIKQVVLIFASGFKGSTLELTINFSRILFPTILGLATMHILAPYLQQHGKFMPIAIVPIVGNGAIIISLALSREMNNIYVLVWGTLVGIIAQVCFYIPWIIKSGFFDTVGIPLKQDKYLPALIKIVIPVFIGETVNEINTIVDRSLVSGLDVGSVSALNYAYKVINLITGVIVASMGVVIYPKLSKLSAQNRKHEFEKLGADTLITIILLLVPITLSTIFYSTEIVQLLFQRGNFTPEATMLTASAMVCYSIGLLGMGARDIISKLFYSIQNTRVPMINGMLCAVFNIILDLILIRFWGIKGAALATAFVALLGAFILLIKAKKGGLINIQYIFKPLMKSLIGVIVLIVFDSITKYFIDLFFDERFYLHIFLCGISGMIGLGLYIIVQYFLGNMRYVKSL